MSLDRKFYKDIETLNEFTLATEQPCPSVVAFSASWCGPCKRFEPVFNLAAKVNVGRVDFYKIDIDNEELKSVVEATQVASVPMYVLFRAGQVVEVVRGAKEVEFQAMLSRAV